MIFKKSSLALLALAAALAFSSPSVLQATTLLGPGTKVQPGTMIEPIQAKKAPKPDVEDPDGKPAKKAEKKAVKKAAGPGRCGAFMYWDKKAKKCADARIKK